MNQKNIREMVVWINKFCEQERHATLDEVRRRVEAVRLVGVECVTWKAKALAIILAVDTPQDEQDADALALAEDPTIGPQEEPPKPDEPGEEALGSRPIRGDRVMLEIKRYTIQPIYDDSRSAYVSCAVSNPDGEYVTYTDHEAAMVELQRQRYRAGV